MKYDNLLDRFIKYVKVNTRSVPDSETTPTYGESESICLNDFKA